MNETAAGAPADRVEVCFVQRRPMGAQVSIERLFAAVRQGFGGGVGWRTHVCPYASKGLWGRVGNLWAAWRACRGRISHVTGDVHYLALAMPRGRFVLTIHDCAILHRLRGWRRELVRLLWFEWPARRAGVVTTISATTRDDLERWLGPGLAAGVRVVPNCVGDEFTPAPKPWPAHSPVILQVGTGWNKNLARVAEALRGLSCRLWIVGPCDEVQRAMLEESGVAHRWLGRLSDEELLETYRQCDALVFVSLFEGFGLPVLEAQATGRPVVTSDRSAMPEVAGDGALLVDPEDVAAIRAAVVRLGAEPALSESLVARGWENVKRFRAAAVAGRYEAIYRELAERGGQRG